MPRYLFYINIFTVECVVLSKIHNLFKTLNTKRIKLEYVTDNASDVPKRTE